MFGTVGRALMQMTRVLPFVGFGRPAEPPTDEIARTEAEIDPPTPGEPREERHILASRADQRCGGGHPKR